MSKLIPLDVPWKVSPSLPGLSLHTETCEGENNAVVAFCAYLGEFTDLFKLHGAYCNIAVKLQNVVYAKLYPEFSLSDKDRVIAYDWELALRFQDKENGFKNHFRVFHDQWNASNICPNPNAYIVVDSDVVLSLGINGNSFSHFMFIGNDYNIEVIAQSFCWNIIHN